MIQDYDPDSVYHVFETSDKSKKFKIGEIEKNKFYDVTRDGNRIGNGVVFNNNYMFWAQFTRVHVEKKSKPLGGYESIAWGAYWTLSTIATIILIVGADGTDNKIFWIIASGIHFWFTIYYRNNKYVVYWMTFVSIVAILLLWFTGKNNKKKFF
jgi:hypothetical protein